MEEKEGNGKTEKEKGEREIKRGMMGIKGKWEENNQVERNDFKASISKCFIVTFIKTKIMNIKKKYVIVFTSSERQCRL